MDRRAVLAVAVLVIVGGAFAVHGEVGPFADAGGDDVSDFPSSGGDETDDGTDDGGTDGGGDGGGATGTDAGSTDGTEPSTEGPRPAFGFRVIGIEACGRTCRDVTAAVHNTGDGDASGVVVFTRLYAGNTTASDDRVWSGRRRVGELAAGASDRTTERVDLTLSEGLAIQNAGGWITSLTQVESDQRDTVRFQERYDVG